MRFTQMELKETKSLGNYESRTLSLTAVIDEGENEAEAINKLTRTVRWYLNKREAEIEYHRHQKVLADKGSSDAAKASATVYIAKYEAALADIEGV